MKKHARFFSLLLASALTAGLSAPALAANGQEYYLKTTVTVEGGLRSGLKNWFDQDGPFTREVIADVMYLMLNFNRPREGEPGGYPGLRVRYVRHPSL